MIERASAKSRAQLTPQAPRHRLETRWTRPGRWQCGPGGRKWGRQAGFNLLEVLITLVVLSVGLLGLAGLQLQSLQYNHSAYLRSQASLQAYDIVDRIRANHRCLRDSDDCPYNTSESADAADRGCNESDCAIQQMAEHDLYEWNAANEARLPAGSGTVELIDSDNNIYEITVRWQEDQDSGTRAEFTYWAMIEP